MTFQVGNNKTPTKRFTIICDGCEYEESWKQDKAAPEQFRADVLKLAEKRHTCS